MTAGVSLLELLAVVAIVAVLAGAAAPSMGSLVDGLRRSSIANEAVAFLWLARSEAIQRGVTTVVCPSVDGVSCDEGGDWGAGWIVFADLDGDARRTPDEAVLRLRERLPEGWRMRGNAPVARYVAYAPTGRSALVSGAFQAGALTLCRADASTVDVARIVLSATGRTRLESRPDGAC